MTWSPPPPTSRGAGPIATFDPGASYAVRTVDAPDDSETETYRLWGAGAEHRGRTGHGLPGQQPGVRRRGLAGAPPLAVARRPARHAAAGAGDVAGAGPGARPARPDPGRGRRDHRGAAGPPGRGRRRPRRGGAARGHDERDARPSRGRRAPPARLRRGRLPRPAEPAGRAAGRPRARPDATPPRVDAARLRDEVLGATAELERLVGDLLVLAAADEQAPPRQRAGGPRRAWCWRRSAGPGPAARVEIDTTGVSAAPGAGRPRRAAAGGPQPARQRGRPRVRPGSRWRPRGIDDARGRGSTCGDDGPGVPPEERERIFERFHRGDDGPLPRVRAAGSAWPSPAPLAARAGGTVALLPDDPARPGACFRLELPALSGGS